MPVMSPLLSARNVTPNSTDESGPTSATAGTAVLGQMLHGHPPLAATIVILNPRAAVCTGLLESVTWTVKLPVPTVVGVPVICPLADTVKPAGRLPDCNDQLYGVVPPAAVRLWL